MFKQVLPISACLNWSALGAALYECKFGPDMDGNFEEKIVDSGVALNCDGFCECEGLSNNKCLFGPDNEGNFIEEVGLSSEMVDSCDREWCICDTHEFGEGESFEAAVATRIQTAVDITIREQDPDQLPAKNPIVIQTNDPGE